MKAKQLLKSKTFDFNALLTAIVVILGQFGVEITPEVVAAIFAVGNWIIRFFTKVPLGDK